jgi:predicted unusual protein kinase regulating ubiquinone biosynthesis (AarF/ABC1/UbiB family)
MKVKTSWLSRTIGASRVIGKASIGVIRSKAATVLGGEEDSTALTKAIVEPIVKDLGQLKGLMMKIGQVASYMDFTLPEEARRVLESLQDSVPPMSPEIVESIIEEELGMRPEELFASWNESPFAAASIGQVHQATTRDGQVVAVKVQYPEIVKALSNDLSGVTALAGSLSPFLSKFKISDIVGEAKTRLFEECDYRKEAGNQIKFRELHKDYEEVIVPKVIHDMSTERVLTSEFIEAQKLPDFCREASQDARNEIGKIIVSTIFRSVLKHGFFNGDPHPGNFLIQGRRVVFLDYGHVKIWDQNLLKKFRRLFRASLLKDRSEWRQAFLDLHQVRDRQRYQDDFYYELYTEDLFRPYQGGSFKFTKDFVKEYSQKVMYHTPLKAFAIPHKDLIIWMRLVFGINAVMAILGAEADWSQQIEPYMNELEKVI